jgi:hypothetical protein
MNPDLIRGLLKKLAKEGDDNDLVKDPSIIRQCSAGKHGIGKGKLRVGQARETLTEQLAMAERS